MLIKFFKVSFLSCLLVGLCLFRERKNNMKKSLLFSVILGLVAVLLNYVPYAIAIEENVPSYGGSNCLQCHHLERHVYPGESIQRAIDYANAGDTIILHPGTYIEKNIRLLKSLTLKSIDPNDPDIVNSTIIDGEKNAGDQEDSIFAFYGDGIYRNPPILKGIKIQNGGGSRPCGGGIYCSNISPFIINCIITENSGLTGGGIHCEGSSPTIINCIISKNSALRGGGICCDNCSPNIIRCTITGNSSRGGAGISCLSSSPIIENSIISNNSIHYCPVISQIITVAYKDWSLGFYIPGY